MQSKNEIFPSPAQTSPGRLNIDGDREAGCGRSSPSAGGKYCAHGLAEPKWLVWDPSPFSSNVPCLQYVRISLRLCSLWGHGKHMIHIQASFVFEHQFCSHLARLNHINGPSPELSSRPWLVTRPVAERAEVTGFTPW